MGRAPAWWELTAGPDRPVGMLRVLAAVVVLLVTGCTPSPGGTVYAVGGYALACPTCPVEPASPQPGQCDPRPVAGAVLIITDAAGRGVGRATTGADGAWTATLAAGGYTLTPQPVAGLLGVAPPIAFTVSAGRAPTDLRVEYDTGIR
jgi:hypothetical protein